MEGRIPVSAQPNPLKFRGWLLVFILLHLPLALYYFSAALYSSAGFWKAGGVWWLGLLNLLLGLALPASLLLLLWRKPVFRWVYVGYSVLMLVNYLVTSAQQPGGITAVTVIVALVLSVPWCPYLCLSKRVRAVLGEDGRAARNGAVCMRGGTALSRTGRIIPRLSRQIFTLFTCFCMFIVALPTLLVYNYYKVLYTYRREMLVCVCSDIRCAERLQGGFQWTVSLSAA